MYLVVKSDQEFVGFNRTFMELKSQNQLQGDYQHKCFNRTFMELKFG